MSFEAEPASNQVAIRFLDGKSDADVLRAVCVGVGSGVSVCKRGETIAVQKYARHSGIKVSDDTLICEEYLVAKAEP